MEWFRSIIQSIADTLARPAGQGAIVGVLVLIIIGLFIFPLSAGVLDVLLAVNILIALVLLLKGLFLSDPIKLFSFPTILLLATLYRLALNVSSTRLILLQGDQGLDAAGQVIEAFGGFVVQGDFIVGAIVFAVIAVVNFVVIAKGSARVAEVSARFTLDALPGKQLAIDSDLRSGGISRQEANQKRELLNRESQFYGSMDGAMKFVQGDAIAGLVITFINAIGGVLIGVAKRDLSFTEAINTFGVLTIGDGLVSILPSLLISVCAGIVVTHVAGKDSRGSGGEIFSQISQEPRALIIASLALLVLSLIPGLPFLPFFLVGSALLFFVAAQNFLGLSEKSAGEQSFLLNTTSGAARITAGGAYSLSVLSIEVDEVMLAPLCDLEFKRFLNQAREDFYKKRGIMLPEVDIRKQADLSLGQYRVLVREQIVKSGSLEHDDLFVVASPSVARLFGIKDVRQSRHPIDGRSSFWIKSNNASAQALKKLGSAVYSVSEYLALEIIASASAVVHELIGVDEMKKMLRPVEQQYQSLVDEIFERQILTYAEFTEVLRRLVREHVSIRDVKLILEGVAQFHSLNPESEDRYEWLNQLHSFLRITLSRSIVADLKGPGDSLRTFVLAEEIEDEFRHAVSLWDNTHRALPLNPDIERSLRHSAQNMFAPVFDRGMLPIVILCGADIRTAVQEFFSNDEANSSAIRALSYQELSAHSTPEHVGVLKL